MCILQQAEQGKLIKRSKLTPIARITSQMYSRASRVTRWCSCTLHFVFYCFCSQSMSCSLLRSNTQLPKGTFVQKINIIYTLYSLKSVASKLWRKERPKCATKIVRKFFCQTFSSVKLVFPWTVQVFFLIFHHYWKKLDFCMAMAIFIAASFTKTTRIPVCLFVCF